MDRGMETGSQKAPAQRAALKVVVPISISNIIIVS
jgi:hypothetical protein